MVQTLNLLKAMAQYKKATLLALGQMAATAVAGDIQDALTEANLWGPPTEGTVGDAIFGAIDRAQYTGKINAILFVDKALNVKIQVQPATAAKVQAGLQNYFGPKMSNALKRAKITITDTMTVPWLENVGY